MTRKKFRIIMVAFIVFSIVVLSGFIVKNFERKNTTISQAPISQVMGEGGTNGSNASQTENKEKLVYFVNENSVKKTKTTSNEITMFVLETKLFIKNEGNRTAHIDPDAFAVGYDTDGAGLLCSIEYGEIEKPILLDADKTTSITFTIKYLIRDVEKFNDYKKHNLKFDYLGEQILVCQA